MENVQKRIPSHPLLIGAAIAVIVFCAAGVAAIMGWIPKSGADSNVPAPEAKAEAPAPAKQPGTTPAKSRALQVAAAPTSVKAPVCKDCGVVESVHAIEKQGEGSGAGAVAGGVLGGVAGHQMGNGRGQDVMTVIGAVGGAVAGHQIEKNMKKSKVYNVTVRLDDGTTRVVSLNSAPAWRAGDRVRVQNGQLHPEA